MDVEEKLTGRNNDIFFFIDKIYTDSMIRDILQHLSNGTDLSKLNISVQVHNGTTSDIDGFSELNLENNFEGLNKTLPTKRKKDQQNFYTCTNQGRINLNDTAVYISWIMSAILCMMILCGNSLILCISLFDKSLNSPISVTLKSLSIISIINAVIIVVHTYFLCEITVMVNMLTGDKSLFCKLKNIYGEFAEKMILYHLCFLALQRTFLTISPLKAHFVLTAKLVRRVIICTYISCLILEIAFVVFEMTPCDAQMFEGFISPPVLYKLTLLGVSAILFFLTVLTSVVRKKISSSYLQSTSQHNQSKLASTVIIFFSIVYIGLIGLEISMYYACQDDADIFVIVKWFVSHLQLMLYACNPIILCLRLKSIRQKLYDRCCLKYRNK
jgi:small-conductance mechanosensitive channel